MKFSRKIVNATAMPIVVPICRNSVRSLVAAPRSWNGTAFWTTIVKTANVGPMPRPAMNIQAASDEVIRAHAQLRQEAHAHDQRREADRG